jgi:ribosomal protein S4E
MSLETEQQATAGMQKAMPGQHHATQSISLLLILRSQLYLFQEKNWS